MTSADKLSERTDIVAADGDHFKVLRMLGKGGMGVVYLAEQESMHRLVAIKMVRLEQGDPQELVQRLRKEAKGTALLDHPNIVRTYSMGISQKKEPFLVMEYVDGLNLEQVLEQGRMPLTQFYTVFEQTLVALQVAHEAGLIHRDIKPSNIIVTKGGITKLMDFGIAKHTLGITQAKTRTGAMIGSPYYVSPEQCTGADVDGRSDLYALGCVMYEALQGRPPFAGQSAVEVMHKQVHDAPARITASVPGGLISLVDKALRKKPEERFASAQIMLEQLRQCRSQSTQVGALHKISLRKPMLLSLLTIALLAAVGFSLQPLLHIIESATQKPQSNPEELISDSSTAAHANYDRYWDLAKAEKNPLTKQDDLRNCAKWANKAIEMARRDKLAEELHDAYQELIYTSDVTGVAPEVTYHTGLNDLKNTFGPDNGYYCRFLMDYANFESEQGKYQAALDAYHQAEGIWKHLNQGDEPSAYLLNTYTAMANTYTSMGQPEKAEACARATLAEREANGKDTSLEALYLRRALAAALLAQGKIAESLALYREAAAGFVEIGQIRISNVDRFLDASDSYLAIAQIEHEYLKNKSEASAALRQARGFLARAEKRGKHRDGLEEGITQLERALAER